MTAACSGVPGSRRPGSNRPGPRAGVAPQGQKAARGPGGASERVSAGYRPPGGVPGQVGRCAGAAAAVGP